MQDLKILKKKLGRKMRAVRREKNLSVEAVALETGRDPGTLYDWEIGATSPSAVNLYLWCQFMGVNMDDMFKEEK